MGVTSWIRRQFKDNVSTADYIPGGLSAGATSFTAHDGTTFPDGTVGPFIITVDQGLATSEKVLIQSRSGAVFTVATGGRGYGTGGAAAQAHGTNCPIYHTLDAQDLDEANQAVVATLGQIQAKGDLLLGSAVNALTRLPIGTTSQFPQVTGGTLAYTSFGTGQSQNVGTNNLDGVQTTPARSDHSHALVNSVGLTTPTYDPAAIAQQVVGTTAAQTVTNKRITRRVVTVTQSATPAINTDNTDVASITGLAQAITSMTTSLTGTPNDGDTLLVRITDNGTGRAITWGAKFEPSTVALPTTTTASAMLITGFVWNTATSAWRCVAVA